MRILACETPKEAWDKLQEEFMGSDRTKKMQVLNLRREFEVLKMKETGNIKDYADRIMKIVNQIRLLGEELYDQRIIEKVLVTLPERFEAKISSLEDSKDFSHLTLAELINAMQAVEKRRESREEATTEGACLASQKGKASLRVTGRNGERRDTYSPCGICKKTNHLEENCWEKTQCSFYKKYGHIEKVCRLKKSHVEQPPTQQMNLAEYHF